MVKPTLDPFRWAMVKLRRGRISAPCLLDRVPRVSVVITCYNYGHYLRQCVDSVTRNQPGIEVEVIIVDDKTTDDSVAVARSIKDRDERVRLILHEQNKGHIATYNDGLDAATGEFVPFLSADDLATPGAYPRRRTAGCRPIRGSGLRKRYPFQRRRPWPAAITQSAKMVWGEGRSSNLRTARPLSMAM
ncbi:glycosyltransferase family 2 protein [Sinorhizobium meliloti]|uniref:glycosyltransferase family 2 protein n=1 Tax=Rhizobium meliloti TaxID=382 RepID=UPI000482E5F2|nr:glycosyltransferase family 2 protein [Sinorhizobium meliloti]